MREHTINLYSFDELSPEAQAKAIEKYRDGMDWHWESQFITEDFQERLAELGYPTDDVNWSLSYCQGDGVAFYGDIDVPKVAQRLLKGDVLELFNRMVEENLTISMSLYRNSFGHHYSHWNTMEVEIDGDDDGTMMEYLYPELEEGTDEYIEKANAVQNVFDVLLESVDSDVKDVSRELERSGYEQIDYYQSDEAITEEIRSNGFEFEEDGTRF